MKNIVVIGNCQAKEIVRCIEFMMPDKIIRYEHASIVKQKDGQNEIIDNLLENNYYIYSQQNVDKIRNRANSLGKKVFIQEFPSLYFTGYHPDVINITIESIDPAALPLGRNHSALGLWAYRKNWTVDDTLKLFDESVYKYLGYFDHWDLSRKTFLESADRAGIGLETEFEKWASRGVFMHISLHPVLSTVAGIARVLVKAAELNPRFLYPEHVLQDRLLGLNWPVYPEIAKALGVDSEFVFFNAKTKGDRVALKSFTLREFLEASFKGYASGDPSDAQILRFEDKRYDDLPAILSHKTILEMPRGDARTVANPYRDLPDYCFWRRSIADTKTGEVDPVTTPKFGLGRGTAVATAGSCFAQHIAKRLAKSGFNYLVSEEAPKGLSANDAHRLNFGVFSARYGNVYTTRQLIQLFDRAYGAFRPLDQAWERADERFIDPFRPLVEPDGFASLAAVEAARRGHLAAVRQMFESLDVFVFTLGLTEAWRRSEDGAVFPMAPGVAGALLNPDELAGYDFVNFDYNAVEADLGLFVEKLGAVNPAAKILLTVSPVPLIATYESRHVLVSTTASKAVLRSAADACARRFGNVDYFPSFEIITGAFNRGAYFEDDQRTVREEGVDHVMRIFFRHYARVDRAAAGMSTIEAEMLAGAKIVCDEEQIEA